MSNHEFSNGKYHRKTKHSSPNSRLNLLNIFLSTMNSTLRKIQFVHITQMCAESVTLHNTLLYPVSKYLDVLRKNKDILKISESNVCQKITFHCDN